MWYTGPLGAIEDLVGSASVLIKTFALLPPAFITLIYLAVAIFVIRLVANLL